MEILRGDEIRPIKVTKTEAGYEVERGLADVFACRSLKIRVWCEKDQPKKAIKQTVRKCKHCRGKGYNETTKPPKGHLTEARWKAEWLAGQSRLLADVEASLATLKPLLDNTHTGA